MLQNHVLPARRLVIPLLALLAAVVWLVAPAPARADTGSSLTVIGTSDVSDSVVVRRHLRLPGIGHRPRRIDPVLEDRVAR